jgi:hypothetical protein
MITNIARAFRWHALIDSGKFSNVHELARAIGKDDAYVLRIIRFTQLAPDIDIATSNRQYHFNRNDKK